MSSNTGPRKRRKRECTPPPPDLTHLSITLDAILNRVSALERHSISESRSSVEQQPRPAITGTTSPSVPEPHEKALRTASPPAVTQPVPTPLAPSPALSLPPSPSTSAAGDVAERLIDALRSLNPVRSNHYYVSDFDPNVHDVTAWCEEVDRAKSQNRWDNKECLARIGLCLKGESHSWLRDWTETDRTWSSFKLQLKSLCPRRVDVANVLYDVMCTESDKYSTYAEYARKSLLRLRIIKGLSSELLCAILVRGIKDPQIRAAAMNAQLTTETIVEFLSIYVMPSKTSPNINKNNVDAHSNRGNRSRSATKSFDKKSVKCFSCGAPGHISKSNACPKRSKMSDSIWSSLKSQAIVRVLMPI